VATVTSTSPIVPRHVSNGYETAAARFVRYPLIESRVNICCTDAGMTEIIDSDLLGQQINGSVYAIGERT